MIELEVVEFPGVSEFKEDLEHYAEEFLSGKILVFRNANCTAEEQEEITKLLGDRLGWWPNSLSTEDPTYHETHEQSMNERNTSDKNSLILGWHLEHVGQGGGTYVGASWCMNLYRCSPDAGKTYFVDMLALFESLSLEEQELLNRSVVRLEPMDPDAPAGPSYKLVEPHWIIGKGVPRCVLNNSHRTELVSVDGVAATDEQKAEFSGVFNYLVDQVNNNEGIRYVQSWQEGDMLILDVFRWAHAVTGGFTAGERRLDGIFGILR